MSYGYKRLIVWQKADLLAKKVFIATKSFPKSELFGLTSQIRRAALSVVLNIVEGNARGGDKELVRFLNIAWGSLVEVEYLIDFSKDMGHLNKKEYLELSDLKDEASKLLWKFKQKST